MDERESARKRTWDEKGPKVCAACLAPAPGDHSGAPRDGVRCHCRSMWLFGMEVHFFVDKPLLWEGDQA